MTDKPWTYCAICRFHHFEVDTYRDWLMRYGDKGKVFASSKRKSKQHEQIERWRGIVERHGTRRE